MDHTSRKLQEADPDTSKSPDNDPDTAVEEYFDPYAVPLVDHSQKYGGSRLQAGTLYVDHRQSKRFLGLALFLPAFAVVIGTAGLGCVIIAWLATHETQSSLKAIWREGAFLLDEGTKIEGGLMAASLQGLTISSAASIASGITTPILMGLYAFRTANAWLKANESSLPTPLQYGLLVQTLGAASILSLASTGQYLSKLPVLRRHSARILGEAFVVALSAYIMVHAVSGVDLWLHVVTSTVSDSFGLSLDAPLNYSVAQSHCKSYPTDGLPILPCLYSSAMWLGDRTTGMLVASNLSSDLRAITISNASDLAVLINPSVPTNMSFRMDTFGARASCEALNPLCDEFFNCPGFGSAFPMRDNSTVDGLSHFGMGLGDSKAVIQSSNCYDCTHLSPTLGHFPAALGTLNWYNLWIEFMWLAVGMSSTLALYDLPQPGNKAIELEHFAGGGLMLTNCTISFYNVSLSYNNGAYAVLDEVLCNTGLSDGLAAPTRLGLYADRLLANVEGITFTANTTDEVMAFLSQDLARLAIGSAGGVTDERGPTADQKILVSRILGRYPIAPIVVLILLLFVHAAFAIVICFVTAFSHADTIKYTNEIHGVSALELAQLRLMNPVALVGEIFPSMDDDGYGRKAELTARTSAVAMFEDRGDTERIRIGLHEDEDGKSIFGVWRRTGR